MSDDHPSNATAISSLSLENLPAEIQLLMLKLLPDLTTLRNLVRASPTHYQLYKSDREGTTTAITFNQLASRGINPSERPDMESADFWEICMDLEASDDELMEAVYAWSVQASNNKGPVKLSSKQCASLLAVHAVQAWSFVEVKGVKDFEHCVRISPGVEDPHFDIRNARPCFLDEDHKYRVFGNVHSIPEAAAPQELTVKLRWAHSTMEKRVLGNEE